MCARSALPSLLAAVVSFLGPLRAPLTRGGRVSVQVTLKCVPAHDLIEHTYATSRAWVRENHARLLRAHKHVRFM